MPNVMNHQTFFSNLKKQIVEIMNLPYVMHLKCKVTVKNKII